MAPFGLMAAGVGLMARSFNVLSCTSTLARCVGVPAPYLIITKALSSQVTTPPKRPPNGYIRYILQKRPAVIQRQPDVSLMEIIRQLAQQWRELSPEEKQPFTEAFQREHEQFKVDLQKYQAQLTPAQAEQQLLDKKNRLAKKKALRKKRELNSLGKPKRPRSAFNIYMAEHYEEARGVNLQGKMKSMCEDWVNLLSHQKQVYSQLAEDDKVRYRSEMTAWEEHMVEVGREDLLRLTSQAARRKMAAKTTTATKKRSTTAKNRVVTKKAAATPGAAATKKGRATPGVAATKKGRAMPGAAATKTVKGGAKKA